MISQVPVTDMLRFYRFIIGQFDHYRHCWLWTANPFADVTRQNHKPSVGNTRGAVTTLPVIPTGGFREKVTIDFLKIQRQNDLETPGISLSTISEALEQMILSHLDKKIPI
jgi:hypothetical protein